MTFESEQPIYSRARAWRRHGMPEGHVQALVRFPDVHQALRWKPRHVSMRALFGEEIWDVLDEPTRDYLAGMALLDVAEAL